MRIKKEFPQKQRQLIIGLPHSDLKDKSYIDDIQAFSEDLLKLEGVDSLFSLTHGPSDIEEGIHNPLWKRLLVGGEEKHPDVSFIVTFLKAKNPSQTIKEIEQLEKKFERKGRKVKISGVPYFVEQMKRNLTQDMKNFTIAAIVLCGLTLLIIFRSFKN